MNYLIMLKIKCKKTLVENYMKFLRRQKKKYINFQWKQTKNDYLQKEIRKREYFFIFFFCDLEKREVNHEDHLKIIKTWKLILIKETIN